MLLTKNTIKLLMAVFVSIIILISFYALNNDKNEILKTPALYKPDTNFKRFENMTFNISGYVKIGDNIVLDNMSFSNYTNDSAFNMYDYTNNRNLDKMDLWHFFAYTICFFSAVMCVYCYFSKRKNEILQVLTFNNLVLVVLFIMFIVNFEKFYYDVYGTYTTGYVKILINTIGVLI
jgi:hypothetical protein